MHSHSEEAFRGIFLQHQSLDDSHHHVEVSERVRQQYALPEKKAVPPAGELHGAPCLVSAVEERTATLLSFDVTSVIQSLNQEIINTVKCTFKCLRDRQAVSQLGAEVGDQDQRFYGDRDGGGILEGNQVLDRHQRLQGNFKAPTAEAVSDPRSPQHDYEEAMPPSQTSHMRRRSLAANAMLW